MYRIAKCCAKERARAPSRYGFLQGGKQSSDSFSDRALSALNISMVTRIESATVRGRTSEKMAQSMGGSGGCSPFGQEGHCEKCVS
eukprot:scaffold1996_cov132-Isochrysis_galbana.AAC.10